VGTKTVHGSVYLVFRMTLTLSSSFIMGHDSGLRIDTAMHIVASSLTKIESQAWLRKDVMLTAVNFFVMLHKLAWHVRPRHVMWFVWTILASYFLIQC